MKNKLYKILGVVVSICLVLTAIFCLPAVAEEVVDQVIVKDYYVQSPGYQDIEAEGYAEADKGAGTIDNPAHTVADLIDIIGDTLTANDTANVYILQREDWKANNGTRIGDYTAEDGTAVIDNAPRSSITAWALNGGAVANHEYTLVLRSPEGQQNFLAYTAYIGRSADVVLGGPTVFENVTLLDTETNNNTSISHGGKDVSFGRDTKFHFIAKIYSTNSDPWTGATSFRDSWPIRYGYTKLIGGDGAGNFGATTITIKSPIIPGNSTWVAKRRFFIGIGQGSNININGDFTVILDNENMELPINWGNSGNNYNKPTFAKTVNFNIKSAKSVSHNLYVSSGKTYYNGVQINGGLQVIMPEGFEFDPTLIGPDKNGAYRDCVVGERYIIERISDDPDIINFAKDTNGNVIAGTYTVKQGYTATATTKVYETTVDSTDGTYTKTIKETVTNVSQNGLLTVPAGETTVTFTEYVEKVYDYYVAHGGTGDGRDINNPAPSVATAVATMNDVVGLTASDTANIWIMQDIAAVKNDGDVTISGATYNKHNLAYWGTVPSHSAKISVKPHPNNQSNNAQANLPTYLATVDRVGVNTRMFFAGPTEIDNIKIVFCTNTNLTNSQYGILNFNGNSVKLGAGVKYCYADTNKAGSPNWTGNLVDRISFSAKVTEKVTTETKLPNLIDIEIAHEITGSGSGDKIGGYFFLPAYDPTYVTFEKDVTLRFTGTASTGRLKIGEASNTYPVTFKQNLNVKITEPGGSWQMINGGDIIVEGGVQMIVSDETKTRGSSYSFSDIYKNAYTDNTEQRKQITNHWILKVNDAMVEAIDFIENEKGKFQIPEFHSAVATNVADKSLTYSADANGILDLSQVPGEYDVIIKEMQRESDTYKEIINYRGYNDKMEKYNGALANVNKKLATETSLNVVYMGGSTIASLREKIGAWVQGNFTGVTINNINKSLVNTNTTFGALRVVRDVISKSPDLLFIEYSLDDYLDGISPEKSLMQFETIVREVKEVYPDCDIVALFASTSEEGSELYPVALAHEEICEKYSISSIDLGNNSEDYFAITNEFLANTLLFGEYGTDYEITKQVLPEMTSKYLFDGNTSFIFPVDVDFTTQGGSVYDNEVKGLEVADYVGMINIPENSGDTVTLTFDGTELYILTNENLDADKTFKVSLDGGESWKIKHYSGSVLTNVVSGLVGGEHTVIIEPSLDTAVGVCGFYSRDIEKATNNLNICDLVNLSENNSVDTVFDYNNDQSVNDDDACALKKILLSDYVKRDYFDTSHLTPIARLGWRPYTGNLPQQSIVSYEKAYETGHRIMLCDIRLTSDGYMVCCHDDDISKVNAYDSNGVKVASDTVKISETTLADLLTYDFGKYKGYAGLQILQPKDFLEFCAQYDDITPVFEFKTIDDERIAELVNLIKQHGFQDNVMFLAGADNGATVANALPSSVIGRWYSRINDNVIDVAASFGAAGSFVHVDTNTYDSEDTINFENYVKAKAKGVDIGITYISSSSANKEYFNQLKYSGIFNFCKYISLDEVSWLYE